MRGMRFLPQKTYPSWEAAVKASKGTYDDLLVNEYRLSLPYQRPDTQGFKLLLSAACELNPCKILDFGGANGAYCRGIKEELPNCEAVVVENATMVHLANIPGVRFTTELEPCDIFFTSGTLPYVAAPMAVLAYAFLNAKVVILCRNSFSDAPIYRVQSSRLCDNGGGGGDTRIIRYPHQTMRESNIIELAKTHGFDLTFSEDGNDALPYKNRVYDKTLKFVKAR